MRINTWTPLKLSIEQMPLILASELKQVVTISSIYASIANARGDRISYPASKAAVNMNMKYSCENFHSENLHVLLLHPGWVKTDMSGSDAAISMAQMIESISQTALAPFSPIMEKPCPGKALL